MDQKTKKNEFHKKKISYFENKNEQSDVEGSS